MATNEIPRLALALCAGFALGTAFFGGLWWTVRRGLPSQWAGLWFTGSFLLRTAVTVTGFYFIALGGWKTLTGCLLGFACSRLVVVRLTRTKERT
jgi:F1F0 ATPase subunit 2